MMGGPDRLESQQTWATSSHSDAGEEVAAELVEDDIVDVKPLTHKRIDLRSALSSTADDDGSTASGSSSPRPLGSTSKNNRILPPPVRAVSNSKSSVTDLPGSHANAFAPQKRKYQQVEGAQDPSRKPHGPHDALSIVTFGNQHVFLPTPESYEEALPYISHLFSISKDSFDLSIHRKGVEGQTIAVMVKEYSWHSVQPGEPLLVTLKTNSLSSTNVLVYGERHILVERPTNFDHACDLAAQHFLIDRTATFTFKILHKTKIVKLEVTDWSHVEAGENLYVFATGDKLDIDFKWPKSDQLHNPSMLVRRMGSTKVYAVDKSSVNEWNELIRYLKNYHHMENSTIRLYVDGVKISAAIWKGCKSGIKQLVVDFAEKKEQD